MATRTVARPELKSSMALVRVFCPLSPWRATALTPLRVIFFSCRSTACLVRMNMMTFAPRAEASIASCSTAALREGRSPTRMVTCSMVSTEASTAAVECSTGLCMNSLTSFPTSPSRVAENNSRCPWEGVKRNSLRTWGRNPMSAIWSASSSATMLT